MSRSDCIIAAQQILWHMAEMLLNSTLGTHLRRRQFDILADECLNRFRQAQANICVPIGNRFDVLSRLYQSYVASRDLIRDEGTVGAVTFKQLRGSTNCQNKVQSLLADLHSVVQRKLAPFICGAFIHGSIATGDSTGFSDVDAAIIVKDDVMVNAKRIAALRGSIVEALRIMMKFDQLQHHGLFIIPEGFLNHYPEDYLPLEVLRNAEALYRPFEVSIRPYRAPTRKKLSEMAIVFSKLKRRHPRNLYELKHILSQFMLLPSLYLQSKGVYVYKKYSFDIVKDEFHDTWWVMDKISSLRQKWQRPESHLFNTLVHIMPNPWYASFMYRKLNWKVSSSLLDEMTDEVYTQMNHLIARMTCT